MTLRVLAALGLLLGVVALSGYLDLMGKGPFASPALRHLRAMKDRARAPESTLTWSLDDFLVLPHDWSVRGYSRLERQGVAFEGYVQHLLRAIDDDFHLELVPTPRRVGGPDTAYVTAEISRIWRRGSERWGWDRLNALFRPAHGGITPWDGGPRRVRVTGWLLYDFQYDSPPSSWALRYGATRVSGWEIHPVTRIEFWDDSLGRYVDYAR